METRLKCRQRIRGLAEIERKTNDKDTEENLQQKPHCNGYDGEFANIWEKVISYSIASQQAVDEHFLLSYNCLTIN